jgi:hypothetical protein
MKNHGAVKKKREERRKIIARDNQVEIELHDKRACLTFATANDSKR